MSLDDEYGSDKEFLSHMAEEYEGDFKGRLAEVLLEAMSSSETGDRRECRATPRLETRALNVSHPRPV